MDASPLTLSELLRLRARQQPDQEALAYPGFTQGGAAARLSFAQLDRRADELAAGLIALGIEKGEHVALWAANVPDWVPLQFALARIGAVLVTVNTALARDEVAFVLQQSKAAAVLHTTRTGSNESSRSLDELLLADDVRVARLRHRVWLPSHPQDEPAMGVGPGHGVGALLSLHALVERGRAVAAEALAAREAACRADDVVNIQYTSGTTGFSKGVMLSHANILGSGTTLGAQLGTTPADRLALIVPLFHCFGCVVGVIGAYAHGATLCCIPAFDAADALRLIDEEKCTLVHGVPTMFSAMLAHDDAAKRPIRTLRAGLIAGAPCPPPLVKAIESRLQCPGISVTYGLTEASPGVAGSAPSDAHERRCETIGQALPGVEVCVVDPATLKELPDGESGELLVRGANVMVGYHDDESATARAITQDGWLRTGDLVLRGPDGNLRVVGRLKDLIIRGGENIAPAEIENVLREHPDIVDAAVVGVADERFGEIIGAALILRRGATLKPKAYAKLLAGRVAKFKLPERWLELERFPLTGSGKVQKFKLREQFAAARNPAAV